MLRYGIGWAGSGKIGGTGQFASALLIESAVASQGASDLADAVGAKIKTDAGIFITNGGDRLASVVHTHEGHDELVSHVLVVAIFHSLDGINVLCRVTVAVHHGVKRFRNPFPAA